MAVTFPPTSAVPPPTAAETTPTQTDLEHTPAATPPDDDLESERDYARKVAGAAPGVGF